MFCPTTNTRHWARSQEKNNIVTIKRKGSCCCYNCWMYIPIFEEFENPISGYLSSDFLKPSKINEPERRSLQIN